MPNRPNDARRPTKAERKEQARLEREAIQRQMAARKRNRTIGLSLVALAAVGAIVAVVVLQPSSGSDAALPAPADLLDEAGGEAQTAACDEVTTTDFYDGFDQGSPDYADQAHIEGDERFPELPPLDTYPSTPPARGRTWGPRRFRQACTRRRPTWDRCCTRSSTGAPVVWYDPDAPADALQPILDFYDQNDPVGQDRVIVAPYDYEGAGGQLPEGVQMALVGWRRLRSCAAPSLPVAFDFTSQYSYPTTQDREYAGEAPERGGGDVDDEQEQEAPVTTGDRAAQASSGGGWQRCQARAQGQARQARAAERKRAERSAFVRRTAVFAVAGVVGVGAFYWLTRAASPRDIPAAAVAAAEAAGCTEVQRPVGDAQAGQHVADGTPITYAQKPATSGEHYGGQVLPSSPRPTTSRSAASPRRCTSWSTRACCCTSAPRATRRSPPRWPTP